MTVRVGTNIFSLKAHRHLGVSTERLSVSSERLSSGLRINRASDDAAGLAIASALNAQGKVLGQGIRNVNDAVSLLNIAGGAAAELTDIVVRIKELATQSANGTYSNAQRTSRDTEAQSLRSEFNRILSSTRFNGLAILDGSHGNILIQAGGNHSTAPQIIVGTGGLASSTVGDGTFASSGTVTAGDRVIDVLAADLNGDGKSDLITTTYNDSSINVRLGNGDGSFKNLTSISTHAYPRDVHAGDFNGDGKIDLMSANYDGSASVSVYIGAGDGSFAGPVSYAAAGIAHVKVGDVNADGILDAVASTGGGMTVLIGNGNGTFKAGVGYVPGGGPDYYESTLADVDGDGDLDIAASGYAVSRVGVYLNNGNGTFNAQVSYSVLNPDGIAAADFNGDGKLDLVVGSKSEGTTNIFLGNGNGTFGARTSYSTPGDPRSLAVGDFNGDGRKDVAVGLYTGDSFAVLLGNGNGSLAGATFNTSGDGVSGITAADINNDGVTDILTGFSNFNAGGVGVFLGNGITTAALQSFSLRTQSDARAAMTVADSALNALSTEIGKLGAQESRLQVELRNLAQSRENYAAASSRITDVDVAEETATYVRTQILQQAGATVLAQANQIPQLAITLLTNI